MSENFKLIYDLHSTPRAPTSSKTVTHLVRLPREARQTEVCFMWSQENPVENALIFKKKGGYKKKPTRIIPYTNCWALDNVLIPNLVDPPEKIQETFDPVSTDNWLFFPGAKIEVS